MSVFIYGAFIAVAYLLGGFHLISGYLKFILHNYIIYVGNNTKSLVIIV